MNVKLLIFVIIFVKHCNGFPKEKTAFVYQSLLYEDVCSFSGKVLICGNENDRNNSIPDLENNTLDSVRLSLNFSSYLKRKQLLVGREGNIKSLWLLDNSISFIESKTFDDFCSLKFLNFYKTNLTTIDENILTKKLGSHLDTLFLSYNNILFLPPSAFIFMTNLITLNLEGNHNVGNFINNGMFKNSLNKLESLNLLDCNITVLNENIFANLTNLEFIILSSNPLTSIPKAINILPKLFSFDFSNTSMVSNQRNNEVHNEQVKIMTFFKSKCLMNIDDCAFCNFPNLWSIDFSWSPNLSQMHQNAFGSEKDMPILNEVKMEFCNISSLPKKILQRRLKLFLKDNPINKKGIITVNVL